MIIFNDLNDKESQLPSSCTLRLSEWADHSELFSLIDSSSDAESFGSPRLPSERQNN